MKLICCRQPRLHALHALILLACLHRVHPQCDLCSTTDGSATFVVKPGTGCVEYVQCVDGLNIGDFSCSGDTVYDQKKGYCNWKTEVTCIDPVITCPPSPEPSTDAPTPASVDCPNPCPVDATGSYTVPGSRCKKYVQCDDGKPVEELECFGDTLFNENAGYCDWPSSYTCRPIECPERDPTQSPIVAPPVETSITIQISGPGLDEAVLNESADCPNPCPEGKSGMQIRPGSQCKKYVQCKDGIIMAELECAGDLVFNTFGQYCDWTATCDATPCPSNQPTRVPAASITIQVSGNNPTAIDTKPKPSNPCRMIYEGVQPRPGTDCKAYVQCQDGEVAGEFTCSGDNVFVEEVGACKNMVMEDWTCPTPSVEYQTFFPTITPQPTFSPKPTYSPCRWLYSGLQPRPGTNCTSYIQCEYGEVIGEFECSENMVYVEETGACENNMTLSENWTCPVLETSLEYQSNNGTPLPTLPPVPPTPPPTKTPRPTSPPKPTPMPTSTYQYFRQYLLDKEELLKTVVFQSNGSPSTEYTFPDFISSLDVAVFQFPADKAFFIGGTNGRLPKLSGMEYGLVNLAAFFANAMEEGIRIDSCDEWNTDTIRDKYPLSNSCGQYGRHYEDEECIETEPFQCALDKTMEVTAVHSDLESKAPPFTCRAKMIDDGIEIFAGYYDSFDDVVVQSPYANTLGRTSIEGCCWWGRGVMMTRGRCTIGKLEKYLGESAVDRGIFVYPDTNFCITPEVICDPERSREFRWVLGLLEWSDRVQSYVNSGWNYLDELKNFVDGGMDDDDFIDAAISIFTRNCHDNKCSEQWQLDNENNLAIPNRRENFRKIIFEVWNLPMTYHPTESPSLPPTYNPTRSPSEVVVQPPTAIPTNKPTRRKKQKTQVIGLQPNSVSPMSSWGKSKWFVFTICIPVFFL